MKTFKHIALAFTALLLVTSCAIDEMWDGTDIQDEEKVLTFKPKFEDFEAVTKAIGDGSKVDKLLVQAYPDREDAPEFSAEYDISAGSRVENIKIPFFYSKTYKVYFWAYDSDGDAYEYTLDAEGKKLLNKPIKVRYPEDDGLAYNALEHLDAFYSVQTVNLSDDVAETTDISLIRPFAQVNLGALEEDFTKAAVTKAQFTVKAVPTDFTLAEDKVTTSSTFSDLVFTFTAFTLADDEGSISYENTDYRYVGTTYIFVPSGASKISVDVSLYAGDKPLKEQSNLEISIDPNKRTNLIFKDIAPKWDNTLADNKDDVPTTETDGWIHISKPEELAALLIYGGAEGNKYHICGNLDMSGMPEDIAATIGYPEGGFKNITIDAGIYDDHKVTGEPVGGGSYMLMNISNLKAFFGTASNITVQNIILDKVIVSGNTDVGVLVNTLSGKNTFKNVTIQNSSATTTTGAAGGMIGYIVRASEKDRAETLSVTIDDCKVNNTSASGTLAEGKFVGLLSGYDNGEQLVFTSCTTENASVTDWSSPYKDGNEGAWLASNDYSFYDGWLGDEVYYRGKVYFGGTDEATNRFCPKWDGEKSVDPLVESNIKLIYSAFDVAKLQKTGHSAVTFKTNVDLGGYKFDPIYSITNLDGENNTIYNLKVDMVHDGTGAAFIQSASGTTTHKDIIFVGADIKNVHNPNIPAPNYGNTNDGGAGNAYAGTLVSHSGGTYTVSNVHVKNGKVYAVCKMGGLVGYVGGNLNMSSCSVDQYLVENYEPGIPNYYTLPSVYMDIYLQQFQDNTITNTALAIMGIHKIPEYGRVNMLQWWYTQGEAGGLIGFVKSPKTVIDGCSVTNTTINCTGQPDKPVVANVWDKKDFDTSNPYISGKPIFASGNTDIAGRHVNQFIGDVVSARASADGTDYDVTISNYTVSGNKYGNTDASSTNDYNHDYASGKYCEVVGCAYYVGVDVGLGSITLKHVNDYAGKLTFYPVGGEATKVVLEEPSGSGNNPTWTGGSFTDMKYEQGRDKIGGTWYNPTYGPWYYKTLSVYPTYP